ncbi:hypothetical protein ACIBLA_14935 [Streptomyces sp. NPDC050433]|uniref:hypothetical protein n=1 Tax=Streptomyces sp. NPDC050433 TaxID=3365615 RepID=UPI0037A1E67F
MRTTTLGTSDPETGVLGPGRVGASYGYGMAASRDEEASVPVIVPQSRLHSTGGASMAIDPGTTTLIDIADGYGPYTDEASVGRGTRRGHRERTVPATEVGVPPPTTPRPLSPRVLCPTAALSTSVSRPR